MHRRTLIGWTAAASAGAWRSACGASAAAAGLQFPQDFGAHPALRTEWWYATGSLRHDQDTWGFQVTFFRVSTGLHATPPSRFDASQLLFAHAAVTDLQHGRLRHDQRIARAGFGIAQAALGDTEVRLRDWQLRRVASTDAPARSRYRTEVASDAAGFGFALELDATQPVLLQGQDGVSSKGPGPNDTSCYYSEPQLDVQGQLTLDGHAWPVRGRAWLDHEWSDAFIPEQAVGWDWIGMNLQDGGALTAFRLRRADGTSVYAGGSHRALGQPSRSFTTQEVTFTPTRFWVSAATRARYPVQWTVRTPAGPFDVRALLDNQELDSRASTGTVYWEGLSELRDDAGRRVGLGYLEMTGYAATLRL